MPMDRDLILKHLTAYDRKPFTEVLARFIGAEPDEEKVRDFANKYPDRWAQGLSILAKLSGFHEKLTIEHNLTVKIGEASDAELSSMLLEHGKALGLIEKGVNVLPGIADLKPIPDEGQGLSEAGIDSPGGSQNLTSLSGKQDKTEAIDLEYIDIE